MSEQPDKLNTCGCCEGVQPETPAAVSNRPGLSSLACRVGTHGAFKESMRVALSRQAALRALTSREDDDPAVALTDAWASVLDILSFYQERIANEGYLRTATERRSLLELARQIGYELGPGVAAGTFLAFTLETAEGVPESVRITPGLKAQSIPGQDEKPQMFETVEEVEARPAWNLLKPRMTELKLPAFGDKAIYLKGTGTNLKVGDALLIVGDERAQDPGNENWDFRRVKTIDVNAEKNYTVVTFEEGLGASKPKKTLPAQKNPKVYALRQRASLFGYNAPDWKAMPDTIKQAFAVPSTTALAQIIPTQWPGFNIAYAATPPAKIDSIFLDALYPQILPGSWLVLSIPEWAEVYRVEEAAEESRTNFTLTAKTAKVRLSGEHLREKFLNKLRETVVYAQSELLEMAEQPVTAPVGGISVALDRLIPEMPAGRALVLTGVDSQTGEPSGEVVALERVETHQGLTRLVLKAQLKRSYLRETVSIHGNIARSTHGESKKEVLGSGDGSAAFQKFELKQGPLTYVSSPAAGGAVSTLELRVDGILWREAASLYRLGPDDRAFITRISDDGKVTVQFGDGVNGARLPTGTENVAASYRVGTGLEGMVKAGQISLLMSRPLGLKAVTNPLAPAGAADPETRDNARANAPLTVLTLDRIVSLRDFEDYARAFAGIGKAQATWLWSGEQRLAHLTVAANNGGALDEGSELFKNLRAGIDMARHPDQRVELAPYQPLQFNLVMSVKIDPAFLAEDVFADLREALLQAFSFGQRAFGQGVTASEILSAAHRVEGVDGAMLAALYFTGTQPAQNPRLPARVAGWNSAKNKIRPAELLMLSSTGITLEEMT